MKIDRAIMGVNDNEKYYQFWPIVAKRWKSWGIIPTLVVISDKKLDIDESIGDVIYVDPTKTVSTGNQSQIVRLFAAASFTDDVNLIADIDMLPLNKEYFVKSVENVFDKMVIYSSDAYLPGNPSYPSYPMCYICGKGSLFREILTADLESFTTEVPKWMSHGFGWFTDEKVFYLKLSEWRRENEDKMHLLRRGFNISNHPVHLRRIDRDWRSEYENNLIEKRYYVDYHMPRPYMKFRPIIDEIYQKTDFMGEE